MSDSTLPIRQRILFRGRVQGVGFRYTTSSIAKRHPIVGYVKNLPDGSVELVVDGEPSAIIQLVDEIESAFLGNICQKSVDVMSREEPLVAFEVRR